VPFVTPEDEAEEFDDSFYTSTPPPPYPSQGPIPGDPRPPGSGHFCHTRFWKVNQMRTMYVPGSEIHVHSDYINDSS
jgi:hypothetical protein